MQARKGIEGLYRNDRPLPLTKPVGGRHCVYEYLFKARAYVMHTGTNLASPLLTYFPHDVHKTPIPQYLPDSTELAIMMAGGQ